MLSELSADLINTARKPLDIRIGNDKRIIIQFNAPPGLYQFSVIADAKEFDWEELYINLYKFNNSGQRTGPWDFHVTEENRALLPSYWVKLDDTELGLWYFQRVSIDDLNNKRFRGRIAFFVENKGVHTLEIKPYRESKIQWLSAILENDPEDILRPLTNIPQDWFNRCPAARWRDNEFWNDMREKLETTHKIYRDALNRSFTWTKKKKNQKPENLPLIIAEYYLYKNHDTLKTALNIIEDAVNMKHWGNQRPDGYGHNGDMQAMYILWSLSLAYHYLYNIMEEDFRIKLLEKLRLQGKKFFDKALLYRDYWGGSVVQDHGWKSMFGFGCAAIHLLDIIPEAKIWVSYIIPRLERSLKAMPEDGFIPASSHYSIHLYLEYTCQYRDALLALTNKDIFVNRKFYKIIDYLVSIVREEEISLIGYGLENIPFVGGNSFLNSIASIYNDGRAAYLQILLLKLTESKFYHFTREHAYYNSLLWGFLNYNPDIKPVANLERTHNLYYYEDSGVVHFRDDEDEVTLSVKSGPPSGYNSYRNAQGPCDRLGLGPGAGHFTMSVKGVPLLMTPDAGYRLLTEIRSCMLVDGKGQKDNIGYTMSIPSLKYEGEEFQYVRWDETNKRANIRINLSPVYPEEAKVAYYTREFIIQKGEYIICRDHVVLDEPKKLSWLFHTRHDRGVITENDIVYIGKNPSIKIIPKTGDYKLSCTVSETPVVWSYSSSNDYKKFECIRYDTIDCVRSIIADFGITWKY